VGGYEKTEDYVSIRSLGSAENFCRASGKMYVDCTVRTPACIVIALGFTILFTTLFHVLVCVVCHEEKCGFVGSLMLLPEIDPCSNSTKQT
jgi:hypothetical protein